jgi:hypothetical protein
MADTPVLEACGSCGQGRAWRAGRIQVLSLQGDANAIGRQHGVLARRESAQGAISHLAAAPSLLEGITELGPIRRWLALRYVDLLYRRLWRTLSPCYRAELRGIAAGAGMPLSAVFRASLLSEVLQLLVAAGAGKESDAIARGGCTAALLLDAVSGTGLLHGKNQDYDAAGHWDNSPTLVITRLDGAYAYAKATSAGLLKGNLALNEKGLSIGGHMLFSSRAGRRGLSFTALENEIMRRAASLGEAIDILRRGPRMGCFAFVVGDASADEAAVIECDGHEIAVRSPVAGRLGMANLYTADPDMQGADLLAITGMDRNPLARQARIDFRLGRFALSSIGPVNDIADFLPVARIAAMLADRVDPVAGVERAVGPLVAGNMTVTSAIASHADGTIWMGEAIAPASAGRFIGFDVAAAFVGGAPNVVGSFGTVDANDHSVCAQRCFIAARIAWEERGDLEEALALLTKGQCLFPADPAFPRFLARLLLRQQRLAEAEKSLVLALRLARTPNEIAEAELLSGHLFDLLGRRHSARAAYERVVAHAAQPSGRLASVATALPLLARRFLQRPFDAAEAKQLAVGLSLLSGVE